MNSNKRVKALLTNILKTDDSNKNEQAISITLYTIDKKLKSENKGEFILDETLAQYFNKPLGTKMLYQNIKCNLTGYPFHYPLN